MNRAAEGAAKQAGPIFLNSIKQMTINDALKHHVGNQQPDAATTVFTKHRYRKFSDRLFVRLSNRPWIKP
jgi:hypothetical protein